ncbi:hypothetical protein AB990_01590 [Alkalihalobacillus pseudalcaliphilus]|nr:hypothetical protein AB990_01590 [Alkalihalobacillus pseudalcaliphilus]
MLNSILSLVFLFFSTTECVDITNHDALLAWGHLEVFSQKATVEFTDHSKVKKPALFQKNSQSSLEHLLPNRSDPEDSKVIELFKIMTIKWQSSQFLSMST